MPLSAVINDGYSRQIVLLCQIVTTNINKSSMNINESYQIRAAFGKMRICGLADFQTCKMRMVLRIFFEDVTGKMRMRIREWPIRVNGRCPFPMFRYSDDKIPMSDSDSDV